MISMFTKNEIRDLIISVFALAFIFSSFDYLLIPITLFVIIVVFLSHELSHKFLAQHYGFDAEYKMWSLGLLLGLVTALIPGAIVFAAPGAVRISPFKKGFAFRVAHLTRKKYALISLAGPLINIILAISLLLLNFFFPFQLFTLTASISFLLAFFNLLPIPPMDGSKIMAWNLKIWLLVTVVAFIGLFI
ncbi:MAG: site-2 protease family protein [Candidatus Aenigmarchaeota archaeon]|nr:site-2 protease family protein [Candidatus Aenigmarchaeota archaeon]